MESNNKSDDYFEAKKIEIKEFEKFEKKQKSILMRRNIAAAVISVATSAMYGAKGYNPFLYFAILFTLPIGGIVYSDLKILSALKKKKAELMSDFDNIKENSENEDRGKKL